MTLLGASMTLLIIGLAGSLVVALIALLIKLATSPRGAHQAPRSLNRGDQ